MNQPESATIWATMENSSHPEYGVVMIPFPIPRESYDSYMEKLQAMGIGDSQKQDCQVVSILSDYSVLKQLEIMTVNVDELDYLAKRLESFDVGEAAQFQAMAHKLELFELKDLINLTFCCQQATVITDFSDLEQVGRAHYMNLHGGCAPTKELEQLNGTETAKQLIDSGKGAITPYNEAIFQRNQSGLASPEDYEKASFILLDYGLDTEVFGVLSIPKLELEMPLYLGATKENMAKGAAVLGQTSLPIGGNNTNCVIAGHRGWNGAAYFLYVPTLEIGDTVTITNLWETLTYRVVETKIIFPDDVDAIQIQPGRELLTLLTCHPPATGGRQRFLVFCERVYS